MTINSAAADTAKLRFSSDAEVDHRLSAGFALPAARLRRSAMVLTWIFMQRCLRDERTHLPRGARCDCRYGYGLA
jgi:hypothetical protein